jgi:hypothetical protein
VRLAEGERGFLRLNSLWGTAERPIVVLAENVHVIANYWVGVFLDNCRHVRLTGISDNGFLITDFTNCGIFARKGTEYVEIDHVEITGAGDASATGIRALSKRSDVPAAFVQRDTYIHHCYIHDLPTSAMYVGAADSQNGTPLEGVELAYNEVRNCGMDAYQVRNAVGVEVHDNYAEDIGWRCQENEGQQGAGLCIEGGGSGRWHHNVIINANTGCTMHRHRDGTEIDHNLFVHCGYIKGDGGIRQWTGERTLIHHNTIVDCNVYGIRTKESGTEGEIRDNFVVDSGAQIDAGIGMDTHHNALAATIEAAHIDSEYRLLPASPAIGAASDGGDCGAFPFDGSEPEPEPEPEPPIDSWIEALSEVIQILENVVAGMEESLQ